MVLCNTGKPPCRKASWARPMHNSTGTTLRGQEACSSVPTASPHQPLLVVKSVLKMLEDTPQVGVTRGSCLWCRGQQDGEVTFVRNAAHTWAAAVLLCCFSYFTIELHGDLQGGLEYFAWPLSTLLFMTLWHLFPSPSACLFCSQKSVTFTAR